MKQECKDCTSASPGTRSAAGEGEDTGTPPFDSCTPEPDEEKKQDPNDPGANRRKRLRTQVRGAWDPNDKLGPATAGDAGFIQPGRMAYEIRFENDPTLGATLAAQEVVVTDPLDPSLDLSTLEFATFGFDEREFTVPPGLSNYHTTVEHRGDGGNLLVSVELKVDAATRQVKATFRTLDPETRQLPDDPSAGFLPVNDKQRHNGEGFIGFSIAPPTDVAHATLISNQASIVFDANQPILTPTVRHRIDRNRPTSLVTPLASSSGAEFSVEWSGDDSGNGSGVATYDLFASDNDGPYTLLLDDTVETSLDFPGVAGHTYRFYSLATDLVGLVEQKQPLAEATTTTIAAGPPWQNVREPKDVDRDNFVVPLDVLIIFNELNSPQFSHPITRLLNARLGTERFFYDVNGDDFVTSLDALIIINFLNAPPPPGEGEASDPAAWLRSPALWINSPSGNLTSTLAPAPRRSAAPVADAPQAGYLDGSRPPSDSSEPTSSARHALMARDETLTERLDEEWDTLLVDLAADLLAAKGWRHLPYTP